MKQIKKIFSFLFILLISCQIYGRRLPLPASLSGLPIYYEEVDQIDGMSCGYNALYNACRLETQLGKANPASDLDYFTTLCLPYLNGIKADPENFSDNEMLENLACLLKLQNFRYLHLYKDHVIPAGMIEYQVPHRATQADIERAIDRAYIGRATLIYNELIQAINAARGSFFIHFVCHVKSRGVGHAVLISLVKDINGGKSMYIHDNMNAYITEHCDIMRYINLICTKFGIQAHSAPAITTASSSSSSSVQILDEGLTAQEKQELELAMRLSRQQEKLEAEQREYLKLEKEYFARLDLLKKDEELARALQLGWQ